MQEKGAILKNRAIAKALKAISILVLSVQLFLLARKLGGKLRILISESLHQNKRQEGNFKKASNVTGTKPGFINVATLGPGGYYYPEVK